jgi:hypothetical protein
MAKKSWGALATLKARAAIHDVLLEEGGAKGLNPSQLVSAYNRRHENDQNSQLTQQELCQFMRRLKEVTRVRDESGRIERYIFTGVA